MNLLAVTISRKPEKCSLPIPFYCLIESSNFDRYKQQREETYYVTDKRDRAVAQALSIYPETTHILSLDTYYLNQTPALEHLLRTYKELDNENIILGAPIWFYRKNRLIDNRPKYYDAWGTPEMANLRPWQVEDWPNITQMSAIGNCIIFPAWTWKRHRFETPEPFPLMGSCYTRLCRLSGLPVLMDMEARLFRDQTNCTEAVYPLLKRMRVSLGDYKSRLATGRLL